MQRRNGKYKMGELHERVEILHERDEDNAVRLHNSYFTTTEIRSDRDSLMQELSRERARRVEQASRHQNTIDRIRHEREDIRKELEECRAELKGMKEKDPETVEGMWAAYARPVKIGHLIEKAEPVSHKRTMRDQENIDDVPESKRSIGFGASLHSGYKQPSYTLSPVMYRSDQKKEAAVFQLTRHEIQTRYSPGISIIDDGC
ncbi:hypothetical protein QFC22_006008 [Naganishia vaughanmartiniae]|uniref:Uncharacterized protein n=1 Tax=Naganishia vaughanmartiniae TaxID=1424756 RepID=A0ACC2WRB2_9TREE|nr:hypothetical protein QFC22_006008 [Naganishia vaughanmartiniae]